MPTYEYVCQECGRLFEIGATMTEYAKGLKPSCPQCGSRKAIRSFANVHVARGSRARASLPNCGPSAGPGCCRP